MFLGVLVAIKVLGNWFVPINVASGEMVWGGGGGAMQKRIDAGVGVVGGIMRPRVQEE